MNEEAVDAVVVEEGNGSEPGTEVVPAPPSNLFRTDDPALVLRRAQETADALMPVVRQKNLVANIQGREYLKVEAWTTLAAMLGVSPVCTWTRKLDNGWEARVEARTLDGRTIGAAEAECLRSESTWEKRDDFALRSMAQTRATSKALASVLRFVATLGGAAGTPAEEMPRESKAGGGEATPAQKRAITTILNKGQVGPELQKAIVHKLAGNPPTKQGASHILDVLNAKDTTLEQNVEALMAEAEVEYPSDVPVDETPAPETQG